MQSETHLEISELQTNLGQVYSVRDRLSKYVRELEQQNDDLERVKRLAFNCSLLKVIDCPEPSH